MTDIGTNTSYSVTFLKPYTNTNYTLQFSLLHAKANFDEYGFIESKAVTGFIGYQSNGGSAWSSMWFACGN